MDELTQFTQASAPDDSASPALTGEGSSLIGFRDDPNPPVTLEGFEPPVPDGQPQDAVASIFANPTDLHRYQMARAGGATEEQALAVGDNGVGKWGDPTATYKFPMVALPRDDPNAKRNALVRITGPGGSTLARVADEMPDSEHLLGAANIDLNPAAAMAVGHNGGIQKVTWQPVADKGELPSLDQVKQGQANAGLPPLTQSPLGRSRISGGMGAIPAQDTIAETAALEKDLRAMTPGPKDPQTGAVTMSDGFTKVYPGGVVIYRRGNQVLEYLPRPGGGGTISKVGTVAASSQPKSPEQMENEMMDAAAKRGIIPQNYPGGKDDPGYKADLKDVLQASRAGVGVDPKLIAQSIINGDAPPTLQGLYGRSGAVRTELEKQKFPLAQATLDWEAQKTYLHTLNGPQQLRLRQATEFVQETTPLVRQLSKEVSAAVPRSQFPVFNSVALASARQGLFGTDAQNKATRLEAQIRDMQSELAIMYSGGNSSTDAKLKQAEGMLSGNWSEGQLNSALDLINTNAQLRLNSIKNTTVAPADQANKYFPDKPPPSSAPTSTTGQPTAQAPQKVDPQEVIKRAQDRLKLNPDDPKAKKVIDYAKEMGMLQ